MDEMISSNVYVNKLHLSLMFFYLSFWCFRFGFFFFSGIEILNSGPCACKFSATSAMLPALFSYIFQIVSQSFCPGPILHPTLHHPQLTKVQGLMWLVVYSILA
jgi:hypothetical protein